MTHRGLWGQSVEAPSPQNQPPTLAPWKAVRPRASQPPMIAPRTDVHPPTSQPPASVPQTNVHPLTSQPPPKPQAKGTQEVALCELCARAWSGEALPGGVAAWIGADAVRSTVPLLPSAADAAQKVHDTMIMQREARRISRFANAVFYIFGSTVTGLAERSSDLDVACDVEGLGNYTEVHEGEKALVNKLWKHYRNLHIWSGLQGITHARCPILKNDPPKGLGRPFDLSFRLFGAVNSHLLRAYFADPAHRVAGVMVKAWSKAAGINNAPRGFLTSYAVILMLLHYLLQSGLVAWIDPAVFLTPRSLDPLPPSLPDLLHTRELEQRVGEVLVGFFRYYAVDFKWTETVVSIRRERVTRSDLGWVADTENKAGEATSSDKRIGRLHLAIEDPYELRNCCGGIVQEKYAAVRVAFAYAYAGMIKGAISLREVPSVSVAADAAECLKTLRQTADKTTATSQRFP